MMKSKPSSRNSASNRWDGLLHKLFAIVLCVCVFAVAPGCSKKEAAFTRTVTEAQKKFEKKCREDFELQVVTRQVGSTFWVYLPTTSPIFDYEALKDNGDAETKKKKYIIEFIDTYYKNQNFNADYDIVDKKRAPKDDYGYTSSYTDAYLKMQNNLFTAISDCFFSAKPVAGEKEPKFVAIYITDIKKGIESRVIFYLEDFKRYMTGDLPNDEYMKRFIAETKGGQSFIGDETGTHINFRDIPMTEFLARQMTNRINFKFQHSDFQPGAEYDTTIVGLMSDTLRYYDFQNYNELHLNNIRLDKKLIYTKEQAKTFSDDKAADEKVNKGKLIHIIFENGKSTLQEDAPTAIPAEKKDNTTKNAT